MPEPFVHLHVHSQYSLLDGANRIDDLVARTKELGMDAIALTDHGNLHGAVDFYRKATKVGVKPILGIEAYVAPDIGGRTSDRTDRTYTGTVDGGFHLVLLAENEIGWRNLIKLSSDAFLNGFYYKPRMDKSTLKKWGEGLIAINGHLGSSLAYHLQEYARNGDERAWERALDEGRWHAEVFKPTAEGEPCFYVELQRHIEEQEEINPLLVRLARELDLPLVCDNDAHFLREEDWDSHDSLVCISTGKIKEAEDRMRYPRDLYLKSPQAMQTLFDDYEGDAGREAMANTARIGERCKVDIDLSHSYAPTVKIVHHARADEEAARHPRGSSAWFQAFCARFELQPFDAEKDPESAADLQVQCDETLRTLAEAGLVWRYGEDGITAEIRARLERELGILAAKDISSYFLIVWDFVNEARRRGIPIGARGSGVGTMVGYTIGISHVCPVRYGLLFERFTDPDRAEYPDIDIDICQDGRGEIIDYVRAKYDADGRGKVAQIITFNVLKAKAVIRDVGRVMSIPLPEVDKICKLVGDQLNITLDMALEQSPDLRKLYDENPQTRTWIDTGRKLEGLTRHAGVHAAGVVIGTQVLSDVVPLAINRQQGDRDVLITQWDGPTCEAVGLLKMDFLGLRTLSILERARQLVQTNLDPAVIRATVDPDGTMPDRWDPLDLERMHFDDSKVLDLFRRGETVSVFQFESDGMRRLLRAMAPDRLEDLFAANALYRPGPMALIDDYNDRKHGRQQVPEVHPIVDKHTRETYGIMVYQEQVMQIVHELGDIPLRSAYTLIKAISKKKDKTINAQRVRFLEGAKGHGLSRRDAVRLFDLILKFAGYGFNKSHSASYAIVAYQTAFLKTYFPVQYMAAVLTFEMVNTDKLVKYIDECQRVQHADGHCGVAVRAPDINTSDVGFTPVFAAGEPQDANHGHIRFGLNAVKGVGEKAIRGIIEERKANGPFTSIYDFCERVPLGAVNRATIEALVRCGAFDSVHGGAQRAALVSALDVAIQSGQRVAADRLSGQSSLFASFAPEEETETPEIELPAVPPWSEDQQLKFEKEALGFYVSAHPLDQHREVLERYATRQAKDLADCGADSEVIVGGLITGLRRRVIQRGRFAGQTMAILGFEDKTGPIDAVVFCEAFGRYESMLGEDKVVFLRGKIQIRDDSPSLLVERVLPIERSAELARGLCITLRGGALVGYGNGSHGNGNHGIGNQGNGSHASGNQGNGADSVGNGHGMLVAGQGGGNGTQTGNGNGHDDLDSPLRHRLLKLRDLLWEAGNGKVDVSFEVDTGDDLVRITPSNLRVKVRPDLPQRIAEVLDDEPSCCRLLGAAAPR